MGLAVSQVRLLALTTRKADIELQMQVNAKRKQMLTRQSTLLSQQYYSRLQDTNIQYATSSGYEDVNYNYLMGQTSNSQYTDDFLQQILTGGDYGIAQKTENKMILTNQYGEVVANNEIALLAKSAKDSYSTESVASQTCHAIYSLIQGNQDVAQTFRSLYSVISQIGEDNVVRYMQLMLQNGGYKSGGTIYVNSEDSSGDTVYYNSVTAAKNENGERTTESIIEPQAGYVYAVYNQNNAIYNNLTGHFYDGTGFTSLQTYQAKQLGNLIAYFGPILSSAIQNGTTATIAEAKKEGYTEETDTDGKKIYKNADGEEVTKGEAYSYSVSENIGYEQSTNTETLQAGFKSGLYQLCMVTDSTKGIYHKNTTLDYFTHMNYVVEKTDASKREEITAWFNAEQAAISEKETYWDEEIQNLSTELSSVNTEIESVKTLKSNAIKSVFDWGGS